MFPFNTNASYSLETKTLGNCAGGGDGTGGGGHGHGHSSSSSSNKWS